MYVFIFTIILIIAAVVLVPFIGLNVIFLLLGGFVVFIIMKRNTELKKTIHKVPPEQLSVLNLDKGGVFKLTGVGENSEELTLKVLAKHLYQEGDFYWYELECDKGDGEKIWVEVEDDDETIVSIVLRKFKLSELGVVPIHLKKMDDNENGTVKYEGVNYEYNESDEAIFYRNCDDSKPEKLYYWDFKSTSTAMSNYTVNVERWGSVPHEEYQAFYCQLMKPSQITVFSNMEATE